jgi:hypothetical protein
MAAAYLIEQNNANIILVAYIAADGALQLRYNGEELSSYGGLEVRRDPEQTIAFLVSDFDHQNGTWIVKASPQLATGTGAWARENAGSSDTVRVYVSQPVEVEFVAKSPTGVKQTRKIYVKTPPKHGLPDPQMSRPNH